MRVWPAGLDGGYSFGDVSCKGHTVSAVKSQDVDNGMKPKSNQPYGRKVFPVFLTIFVHFRP
jgi:hypothetical protein